MTQQTRRQALRTILEQSLRGMTPHDLRNHLYVQHEIDISESDVLDDLDHIRQSLRNDSKATLSARPPECRDCGFTNFDSLLKTPSSCPECRSEWILPPKYTIKTE